MAPLDTGSVPTLRLVEPLGRPSGPTAEAYTTLGAYLQAVREHRGDTLADLSDSTRIRVSHLKAIEADDFDVLPSRPFAIGYVRAYARALRLDGEAAVARFKREVADDSGPVLKAPIGVAHEADARRPVMYALGGAVLAAVVLWNIAQRTMHADDPTPSGLSTAVAASDPVEPAGMIRVSAPTAASAEQGAPAPYVTPGLEADANPAAPGASTNLGLPPKGVANKGVLLAAAARPAPLELRGAVFGAPEKASTALLLARKSSALIVRGAGGAILFARELEEGQAYRLPLGQGLTAEVSDPSALDLYVGGQLRGTLTAIQTPLDKLPAVPAPLQAKVADTASAAKPAVVHAAAPGRVASAAPSPGGR